MGFLKKLTRPISKILDKIIPNEIKPALPYLSAFAPYMAPGLFGAGASGIGNLLRAGKYANVLGGGILGGGLNIGAQLAQEGSEGEFSGLSALLAAGQGAMAVPGAEETFASSRIVGRAADGSPITAGEYATLSEGTNLGSQTIDIAGTMDPGIVTRTMPIEGPLPFDQVVKGGTAQLSGLDKARNIGLRGLEGGSKFIEGAQETLKSPGLNKETLTAIAPGAAQGTGDLAMADARRALADYDAGLEEGSEAFYDDTARAIAIRRAMEAAGHIEDDITSALSALGLKQGGIVGLRNGGRIGFDNGGFEPLKYTSKIKEMWEMEGENDPLGTIVKIGLTVRAPIVDIVRILGITGAAGASLVAEVAKLGYDVTKPIRDVASDTAGAIYNVGKDVVKGSKTDTRFINPAYYMYRFAPEKNLTDKETQLEMMKDSVGRDDPKKRRELENIVFGFDDAGMNQTDEDMEVSQRIKFNEKYNMADGGMMSVLPRGTEMDYRGGGMIPMGSKEKADDVPARLSKNEFVMTADAVRAAGGGSVNKGAKRMYDLMHNLEARV